MPDASTQTTPVLVQELPDASTQTTPVLVQELEEESSSEERFELIRRLFQPCGIHTQVAVDQDLVKPGWDERLYRVGNLASSCASYCQGHREHLPFPMRWRGYQNHYWVVLRPSEYRGLYSSWAACRPLVQTSSGDTRADAIVYGHGSKKEAVTFLEVFRSHYQGI